MMQQSLSTGIKKIFLPLGISLAIIGILSAVILVIIEFKVINDYEKYDYSDICIKGTLTNAKVSGIDIRKNINVNGMHPVVITYEYKANKEIRMDNFQTLESKKIQQGESINIYVYKEQSVIAGLNPFSIPFKLFWILPTLLIAIGTLFVFLHFKAK